MTDSGNALTTSTGPSPGADLDRRTQRLLDSLRLAVPLEIELLRAADPDQVAELGHATAGEVAQHGDDLLFGGERCAPTFAALVRGLAALALTAWGGVTFAGIHWCADRSCPGRDAPHDLPVHPDIADPEPRRPGRPTSTVPIVDGLL